jgi:hypothetical protein
MLTGPFVLEGSLFQVGTGFKGYLSNGILQGISILDDDASQRKP